MEEEYEDEFEEEQRERERERERERAILREAKKLKSLGVYDTVEDAMDEARVIIEECGGF